MLRESTNLFTSLAGKRVALTGFFNTDRDLLKKALNAQGALVYGSVMESTDLLIVGFEAGIKVRKAAEYGVQTIGGDEAIEALRKLGHRLPAIQREPRPEKFLQALPVNPLINIDRLQLQSLGDNFQLPPEHRYQASELAREMQQNMQRHIDDALANVVAAIMLQLGVTELKVDDAIRQQVQQKAYLLDIDRYPGAINFILTEVPGNERQTG